MPAKFRANPIYQALKKSDKYSLTPWQERAIESDPTSPTLVIAGAGSGKTELMAVRVLWLVANGYCRPDEVLGLTFTRKAAASLSRRISDAIKELRKTEFWPSDLTEDTGKPAISTYNSYANSLFRDSALALGYEPESLLLSEAQRYQLAKQVVLKHAGDVIPNIDDLGKKPNDFIRALLSMVGEMNDHDRSAEEIEKVIASHVQTLSELPAAKNKTPRDFVAALLADFELIPGIAKLAQLFREEKHRLGYVDYSDQVLLAKKALEITDLSKRQQAQYKFVLLDEYQDTSYLQTALLEGLFKGTPVYAVGDPNQSIYGWRGASSSNLAEFINQFATDTLSVVQHELPTSWRNPELVLDLANHIASPLKHQPSYSQQPLVDVDRLLPRPGAPVGEVSVDFLMTLPEEVARVADWFVAGFEKAKSQGQAVPTAALLLRKRANMGEFVAALQNRGLSVEVLGLGGLMQMPEVVDLVSALKVINSPSAGPALIRLLTGARWRIGARDIVALNAFADNLSRNKSGERDQDGYGADYDSSIVDALDLLISDYREWKTDISAEGLARMQDAARLFRNLRAKQGLPLQELVRAIEQELWLDIELRANPSRVNPMQHLNAFANIVGNYDANSSGGLASFLEWLDYAAELERFDVAPANAQAGVVQVMTIHASKGLEWQMVAVGDCSMAVSSFKDLPDDYDPMSGPSGLRRHGASFKNSSGWLKPGTLPFALRGDAASLPTFQISGVETQDQVKDLSVPIYKAQNVEMLEREERRLMYVALTRPEEALLVTGSAWKSAGQKGPRVPDYYLESLIHFDDSRLNKPSNYRDVFRPLVNPLDAQPASQSWPLHPIGPKLRDSFDQGLREAHQFESNPAAIGPALMSQINLLLDERATRLRTAAQVQLPVRIQASRFKDFVTKTDELAERFRRPVPEKPYKSTMQGTLFHNWVEARFGFTGNQDEPDRFEATEADDQVAFDQLERLKETFEKSRWANAEPADIECEIQVTIGANTFICKLDAVFETPTGFEIVDWKTGKLPNLDDENDMFERSLQLALYRMAYARYRGVDESQIEVSLYFVDSDREIRPERVLTEAELIELWNGTVEKATS